MRGSGMKQEGIGGDALQLIFSKKSGEKYPLSKNQTTKRRKDDAEKDDYFY